MKRSTERILTTHAGSLARPPDLLEMMRAKDSRPTLRPRGLCGAGADRRCRVGAPADRRWRRRGE